MANDPDVLQCQSDDTPCRLRSGRGRCREGTTHRSGQGAVGAAVMEGSSPQREAKGFGKMHVTVCVSSIPGFRFLWSEWFVQDNKKFCGVVVYSTILPRRQPSIVLQLYATDRLHFWSFQSQCLLHLVLFWLKIRCLFEFFFWKRFLGHRWAQCLAMRKRMDKAIGQRSHTWLNKYLALFSRWTN